MLQVNLFWTHESYKNTYLVQDTSLADALKHVRDLIQPREYATPNASNRP